MSLNIIPKDKGPLPAGPKGGMATPAEPLLIHVSPKITSGVTKK